MVFPEGSEGPMTQKSNPMDSWTTKLLKTKTVNFSTNNKQFPSNYVKKSQNNDNIFMEKSKK